jgi:hypothetical protein
LDTLGKDGWKIKGGGDIVTDKEYENFLFHLNGIFQKAGIAAS